MNSYFVGFAAAPTQRGQSIGYNCFAWAYYEYLVLFTSTPKALCFSTPDLVLFTSTPKALCFSTPEMTEFLHGTVTACS